MGQPSGPKRSGRSPSDKSALPNENRSFLEEVRASADEIVKAIQSLSSLGHVDRRLWRRHRLVPPKDRQGGRRDPEALRVRLPTSPDKSTSRNAEKDPSCDWRE